MASIIGIMALCSLFFGGAWILSAREALEKPIKANETKRYGAAIAVFIIGFIARCIAAVITRGHETDMACFEGWSDQIFNEGVGNFYLSNGFHDYPPGYVYVMYVLGALKSIFKLENEMLWLVIKMPSILCDLGIAAFIYKALLDKYDSIKATIISAFFVFNPVTILNSCIWGQVDSVLALFMLLSVYYATHSRFGRSFIWFIAAFLIKPQAVFVAPVIGFAMIEEAFIKYGFNKKALLNMLLKGVGAVVLLFVLFMPFGNNPIHGIEVIIKQYIETVGQYDYMTVNAFNLYGVFNGNWEPLTTFASIVGYLSILGVVVFSGYVFFRSKNPAKNYLSAFILVFGIYMLSVKMHERYAFPAIVFAMMAFAMMPSNKSFSLYGIISLSQFFNIAWVLFVYQLDPSAYFRSSVVTVASFINLIILGYAVYMCIKGMDKVSVTTVSKGKTQSKTRTGKKSEDRNETKRFAVSEKASRLTCFDIIVMVAITVVYACVAFYNLGDKAVPVTEISLTGRNVTIDMGEEKEVGKVAFYLGSKNLETNRDMTLWFYDKDRNNIASRTVTQGSVLTWNFESITPVKAQYIVLTSSSQVSETDPTDCLYLKELVIMDNYDNVITPVTASQDDEFALFDEQGYMANGKSYMAGTYFDEIYHARTAYEMLNDMSVYEWTHPPLGKILIGVGISLFGMVPFGWRFIGTLFGVLMVLVMYLIAKHMFKYSWLASLTTILFAFDFMHFTQTRIATIDTYIVFFIMLMYYFMYRYYKMSFYDTPLKKTFIPLGLSGICFGLGVASKWTGMYAGAGLAILFFITLWRRYKEYKYAKLFPKGETEGIKHMEVIDSFKGNTIKTLVYCVLMFVVIPFAIYSLAYIPHIMGPSGEGFKTIFTNAQAMMTYHGKTVVDSTHPYSSYWYEWPIMYRPIYYFSNTVSGVMKQGISAFGNPAVWWVGIVAIAYTLAVAVVIPCRAKKYFKRGKGMVMGIYTAIFALLCVIALITSLNNEKYVRFFPCMLLYTVIFVGMFALVLYNDGWFKKVSAKTAMFIAIGFFAQLLPWTLVLRTTYIYHFFTCVPFVVMAIAFSIKTIYDNSQNKKAVLYGAVAYTAVAVVLFMLFYPVISGSPVSADFVDKYLRWYDSWVLVS